MHVFQTLFGFFPKMDIYTLEDLEQRIFLFVDYLTNKNNYNTRLSVWKYYRSAHKMRITLKWDNF